jgi:glycosyltransferase involved in cell wall biosynthesis
MGWARQTDGPSGRKTGWLEEFFMKLAVVCTHPIQYLAPVFRELASREELQLKVFYGWEGTSAVDDPGFGRTVTWDIPLLDGYEYEFVPNVAASPGSHHFQGINLPSLNKRIEEWGAECLLVYGWSYRSHLAALKRFKHHIPVLFRGDSTQLDEKPGLKRWARLIYLNWVYRHIDIALSVGTNNRRYFEAHGVAPRNIVFAPHAVDNDRFSSCRETSQLAADQWREELGIDPAAKVFLFVGKLEEVKSPERLLVAFKKLNCPDSHLVFVGTGPLESELRKNAGDRVHFVGFQNQSRLPVAYRLGDVVVLCSRSETWGLALNEAMACERSLIASDRVGAAVDLIEPSSNGWCFAYDSQEGLYTVMKQAASHSRSQLRAMGMNSLSKVQSWSIRAQVDAICTCLQNFPAQQHSCPAAQSS